MSIFSSAGSVPNPMEFLNSISQQAQRGLLTLEQANMVSQAYVQALPRGGSHLLAAVSAWATLLGRILAGDTSFATALDHWKEWLRTGLLPDVGSAEGRIAPSGIGRGLDPFGPAEPVVPVTHIGGGTVPRYVGGPTYWDMMGWGFLRCPPPEIELENYEEGVRKTEPGVLLVRHVTLRNASFDNEAPMQKMVLKWDPKGVPGTPVLQIKKGKSKLKVYLEDKRTVLKFDPAGKHPFAHDELIGKGKTFYVEGVQHSTVMRDIRLKLYIEEGPDCPEDDARFTVLWVDKPQVRFTDGMSPDAPKDERERTESKRPDAGQIPDSERRIRRKRPEELGLDFFEDVGQACPYRLGYLVEVKARIHPRNFASAKWEDWALKGISGGLHRDLAFADWERASSPLRYKEGWRVTHSSRHSASLPWKEYTNDANGRAGNDSDQHPRQFTASEQGYIYNYDVPGLPTCNYKNRREDLPEGYARMTRNHFLSFAAVIVRDSEGNVEDSNGKWTGVQCSALTAWVVSLTMVKYGNKDTEWVLASWFDRANGVEPNPGAKSFNQLWNRNVIKKGGGYPSR